MRPVRALGALLLTGLLGASVNELVTIGLGSTPGAFVAPGASSPAAGGAGTSGTAGRSATSAVTASASVRGAKVLTLEAPRAYQPHAAPPGTDDYHCTLLDPHLRHNVFIVGSQFFPASPEVHHAIVFLVPPSEASAARAANRGGRGWSCFGESAIPGKGLNSISDIPWLAAWGPGAGFNPEPAGTGVAFPAGSLVVMQEHYNLLVGHRPVHSRLVLDTVPATSPLKPLSLSVFVAPPDVPCAPGVHGRLCSRPASLHNLGERFGRDAVDFVNLLEQACGRSTSHPPAGDTTSCTWPVGQYGFIVRTGAHMHLLGVSLRLVLDPGTRRQRTLLDVGSYDFHNQRSYDLAKPVYVTPSDRIKVSCTYDPRLHALLPLLRTQPARFVTWGDGSVDEMCIGLVFMTPAGPHHRAGPVGWPRSAA